MLTRHRLRVFLLTLLLLSGLTALTVKGKAEGLPPDPGLMGVKGYSSEVTTATQRQRLKQEWKHQTTPYRTPGQQLMYNLVRNDWLGALDEFGSPSFKD